MKKPRIALLTGATGFLGANLSRVIEEDEEYEKLYCFGYYNSETKYISALSKVEVVFGDITKKEDVEKVFSMANERQEKIDVVFHCAGDTSFWGKLYERQRRVNVEGTRNVSQLCRQYGVKCLVYTSTVDVMGAPALKNDEPFDENSISILPIDDRKFNYGDIGYNYAVTKREAERVALSYNGENMKVVAIRPGSMMGPFDFTLQFGRIFLELQNGDIPGSPPGGTSWCSVKEVAKAHVAAVNKGIAGSSYICAGINETYNRVFALMARRVDAKPPKFNIPYIIFVIYAYVMEFISNWITNKPPQINPGQARYMSFFAYYWSRKAMKELDYKIPSLDSIIDDAFNWYLDNKFIKI